MNAVTLMESVIEIFANYGVNVEVIDNAGQVQVMVPNADDMVEVDAIAASLTRCGWDVVAYYCG